VSFDPNRDVRLPDGVLRPEYLPLLATLEGAPNWEEFRKGLQEAVMADRYLLAVLCGYDTERHRWDDIHLWIVRERIPELRAIPGAFSAWFCPRGTFKTAIEEVDIAWSVLTSPNRTYGVGSWKQDVAIRIVRQVRRILDNPAVRWLFPEVVWPSVARAGDKWGEAEFTVQRQSASKDSSVTAFALEAPATSLHFDRLYLDDVVEKRNASTEYQIEKVKETLRDIRSLRSGTDSQIEVRGTFWDPEDWHNAVVVHDTACIIERHPARVEEGEGAAPCPIVGLKPGDALFPSTKPLEVLAEDERSMGTWHFECQMLLKISAVGGSLWTRDMVCRYYQPDALPRAWSAVQILDLATESPDGANTDDTALALVAAGPAGPGYKLWILDGVAETRWAWPDVARKCYDWYEEWNAPLFVEEVGAFTSFETALLHEADRRGYALPHRRVKRAPGTGGKIKERIKLLATWYEQGRILTRDPATVKDERCREFFQKYERQATRWPRVAHDDVLDVIAEATAVCLPPAEGGTMHSVMPQVATRARVR